jgi:hypothetical protein
MLGKEHSFLLKYTSLARTLPVELPREDGGLKKKENIYPHSSHHRTKFSFLHKTQGHTVMAITISLSRNKSETFVLYYKGT